MNSVKIVLIIFVVSFRFSLSHVLPEITLKSTKSDICPHGLHYVNSCMAVCSCSIEFGDMGCVKMPDCHEPLDGFCPVGSSYKDPMWGSHFECFCNMDESQTYECFDLRQHKTLGVAWPAIKST